MNRELSADELALLKWLLEHGEPEAAEFVSQLDEIRAVGKCECGCPSIDLGVGGASSRTVGASWIIADFVGVTREGVEVGVLLHVRDGKLSELEIYSFGGVDDAFSLPPIETLRPF